MKMKFLIFFATAEGYVNVLTKGNKTAYNYVYNYTDHLGNIRLSYTESPEGEVEVLEENHYYPFGLKHKKYGSTVKDLVEVEDGEDYYVGIEIVPPGARKTYQYKYNGKEFQDELNLNFYDYGARNYDPSIGRWMNIDPLAEKRYNLTPYNYVQNSPLFRFDPDGLTDFILNKKTGEVTQVGEANDEPDRILKTNRKGEIKYNRKGEVKVAVEDIAKNILKDGQNFKTDSNLFEVGGEGNPSREDVEKFALQLSKYIGTEIGGSYFSKDGANDVTHIAIGAYQFNEYRSNKSSGVNAIRKASSTMEEYNSYKLRGFFHTHPNESTRFQASGPDKQVREERLKTNPSLFFIIITYPERRGNFPHIIDYTKH